MPSSTTNWWQSAFFTPLINVFLCMKVSKILQVTWTQKGCAKREFIYIYSLHFWHCVSALVKQPRTLCCITINVPWLNKYHMASTLLLKHTHNMATTLKYTYPTSFTYWADTNVDTDILCIPWNYLHFS